jgi:rhodanese-related sulfurtransferase
MELLDTRRHEIQEVDAAVLQGWLDQGEAVLVDVREPGEHAAERIAGAALAPLSAFDPRAVLPVQDGRRLVLYCRSGNRSSQAGRRLRAAGCAEVYHLRGGLLAWREAGCPVEARAGAGRVPDLMRQVQMTAGSLVLLGTVLGALASPWFLLLSGGVGAGLVYAGATGTCGMAMLLARMPWNRAAAPPAAACPRERP